MVAYAQQEMDAAGQSPDASTTLFQGCTVAIVQVGCSTNLSCWCCDQQAPITKRKREPHP